MNKIIQKIGRRIKGLKKWLNRIISDFWQNWIAAGVCCPVCIRPVLYRMAGNKVGEKCYISPHIFLGPGPGKLFIGGGRL